jgi:hypothetical protein
MKFKIIGILICFYLSSCNPDIYESDISNKSDKNNIQNNEYTLVGIKHNQYLEELLQTHTTTDKDSIYDWFFNRVRVDMPDDSLWDYIEYIYQFTKDSSWTIDDLLLLSNVSPQFLTNYNLIDSYFENSEISIDSLKCLLLNSYDSISNQNFVNSDEKEILLHFAMVGYYSCTFWEQYDLEGKVKGYDNPKTQGRYEKIKNLARSDARGAVMGALGVWVGAVKAAVIAGPLGAPSVGVFLGVVGGGALSGALWGSWESFATGDY